MERFRVEVGDIQGVEKALHAFVSYYPDTVCKEF